MLAEALFLTACATSGGAHTMGSSRHPEAADFVIEGSRRSREGDPDQNRIAQILLRRDQQRQEIGSTKAFKDVGEDGVISIEEGKGTGPTSRSCPECSSTAATSPHFATDQKTLEAELRTPILIHEDKISNVKLIRSSGGEPRQ